MAEQVFQEHATGGAPQTPSSPAGACFAGVSRLAFDVAAGDQIELTVAGILDAMARLPMAIVPLAAPRRIWYAWLEPGRIAAAPLGELAAPFESAGATGTALMVERVRATRILTATGLGVAVRSLEPEVRRAVLTLPIEDRAAALAEISRVSEFQRAAFARLVRNPDPRPAFADETAIEVPSRLQLSPSVEGGWAHAVHVDEERGDGTGPVELWHTRLGVRKPRDDGTMEVDETDPVQRIVRGVWTRDLSTWGGPAALARHTVPDVDGAPRPEGHRRAVDRRRDADLGEPVGCTNPISPQGGRFHSTTEITAVRGR